MNWKKKQKKKKWRMFNKHKKIGKIFTIELLRGDVPEFCKSNLRALKMKIPLRKRKINQRKKIEDLKLVASASSGGKKKGRNTKR